jgi:transposase-like protein
MTKTVLETALNEEITEHLGYEKHDRIDPLDPRRPRPRPATGAAVRLQRRRQADAVNADWIVRHRSRT